MGTTEVDGPRQDGRSVRSQRTRRAVIEAVVSLLREGHMAPAAPAVAERAGVSTRSVYVHFATMEDLHRAVTDHVAAEVAARLAPIDPEAPLPERAVVMCRQRARINEELGPLLQAGELHAVTSPEVARARAFGREASRAQVARIFAPELGHLGAGARRRRVAAVDALLGAPTWRVLRTEHGLAPGAARQAVEESVLLLLDGGPPTTSPPGAPAAVDGWG